MLEIEKSCLVIVDVQGKLAQLMHDKQTLFDNIEILIKAAGILDIPIINCRQYPKALGDTIDQLAGHLEGIDPVDKLCFSCLGSEEFAQKLDQIDRPDIILTGIETHVCIYQTAMDLLNTDHSVHLITDAVSSRKSSDRQTAIERMRTEGVKLSTTEMVLFELLKTAKHEKFKQIANLIK